MGNNKSKKSSSTNTGVNNLMIEEQPKVAMHTFIFYSLNMNGEEKNFDKLLPKEIIIEIANYLEIREFFQLAKCCKLLYDWLFSDQTEFWNRIANGPYHEFLINDGDEFKLMYSNLWNRCLEFEKHQELSNYLDSQVYSDNSNNYGIFTSFLEGIDNDFNQMMYILRNSKRCIILRAYIAIFGLENYETDISYDEKLEHIFQTLCLIEDGTTFIGNTGWEEKKPYNLLSLMFDLNFKKLKPDAQTRIENYFLRTTAFRVNCARGSFGERAMLILSTKFRRNQPNSNEYYDLLLKVLTSQEMRNTLKNRFYFQTLIEYFQSYRREESIEVLIDLLRSNEIIDGHMVGYITCLALKWEHPKIFNELMDDRYFSIECSYHYVTAISRYIFTNDDINLTIRNQALDHIVFICKNRKNTETSNPSLYYIPYCKLKEFKAFPSVELKERGLYELKECIFEAWKDARNISIITEMFKEDRNRTINQLLDLKPLSLSPETDFYTVEEAFRMLQEYSNETLPHTEYETFFPRVIEFLEAYCLHPEYHTNDSIIKLIVKAAEWIKPKHSIEKLYDTMKKSSETSSFIQCFMKQSLPSIESL